MKSIGKNNYRYNISLASVVRGVYFNFLIVLNLDFPFNKSMGA